jgi:hypothetical protein
MVDVVLRVCVALRRRVSGHAYRRDLLTLPHHMDTPAPDINLRAMRAVDITESVVLPCLTDGVEQVPNLPLILLECEQY